MADYTIDTGSTAWVLMCSTLVFLMVRLPIPLLPWTKRLTLALFFLQTPALGLFYAGLARAKHALSLMYLTMLCVAVVSFQVYIYLNHLIRILCSGCSKNFSVVSHRIFSYLFGHRRPFHW